MEQEKPKKRINIRTARLEGLIPYGMSGQQRVEPRTGSLYIQTKTKELRYVGKIPTA